MEILDDVAGPAPGEEWTWDPNTSALNNVPIAPFPTVTTFIATASGRDPLGLLHTFPGDPNEQATVLIEPSGKPCIDVTKEVNCEFSKVGDEVIYTICIENCGETTVIYNGGDIIDSVLGDLSEDFGFGEECFIDGVPNAGIIPPGFVCCIDFPYTIQPGDDTGEFLYEFRNDVVFSAIEDEFGQDVNDANAFAIVTLVHPCLDVDVECISPGPVMPGEDAQFRVTLTNCGDVDLSVDVSTNWGICEETDLFIPAQGGTEICEGAVPVPPEWTDPNICLEVAAHWDIFDDKDGCLDNEDTIDANACCPVEYPGGEGCTPGFWKNNGDKHGASAWCDSFSPSMKISDVFFLNEPLVIRGKGKSTITDPTLLQALDANGGGVNAMIRHGIAAMLNACSPCVQYPINSPLQVIFMIEDALNGVGPYTIDELHAIFAGHNEDNPCPVNQHGECVGVEEEIMLP
jgi:hypothetical protein